MCLWKDNEILQTRLLSSFDKFEIDKRETGRQRQTETDRDRQTDRQTDRQADRQADRQTNRHRQTDIDKQTQTDRQTDKQTDRKKKRKGKILAPHLPQPAQHTENRPALGTGCSRRAKRLPNGQPCAA